MSYNQIAVVSQPQPQLQQQLSKPAPPFTHQGSIPCVNYTKQMQGYNSMGVACLYPGQPTAMIYQSVQQSAPQNISQAVAQVNVGQKTVQTNAAGTPIQIYPQYYTSASTTPVTTTATGYPYMYTNGVYNTPYRYAVAPTSANNYVPYTTYQCMSNYQYFNQMSTTNNLNSKTEKASVEQEAHIAKKNQPPMEMSQNFNCEQPQQTQVKSKHLNVTHYPKVEENQTTISCKVEQTEKLSRHNIKIESCKNEGYSLQQRFDVDHKNDQAILQSLKTENDNINQSDKIQKKDQLVKYQQIIDKCDQKKKQSSPFQQIKGKQVEKKQQKRLSGELQRGLENIQSECNQQKNNNNNLSHLQFNKSELDLKSKPVIAFQSYSSNDNSNLQQSQSKFQGKTFLSTHNSEKSSPASHFLGQELSTNGIFKKSLERAFKCQDNYSLNQSSCEVQGDASQTALLHEHVADNNEHHQQTNEELLINSFHKNISSINTQKENSIQVEELNEETPEVIEKNQHDLYKKAGKKFNRIQQEINKIQKKVKKILIQEFMNKNYNYLKIIEIQIEDQREKFFKNMTLNQFVFEFLKYTQKKLRQESNNDKQFEKIKGRMLGKVTNSQEFLNHVVNHEVLSSIFISFIISPIEKFTSQIDPEDQQEYQNMINKFTEKVFQQISKLEFVSVIA